MSANGHPAEVDLVMWAALRVRAGHPSWIVERAHTDAVFIHCPWVGYITVDFRRRGYRLGLVSIGIVGEYRGAGWRERLLDDAIRAMDKLEIATMRRK